MANVSQVVQEFFEGLSDGQLEDRVVEYVVRELHKGRRVSDVLDDPYVRNRLNEEKLKHLTENPELIDAIEAQISASFKAPDLGFSD